MRVLFSTPSPAQYMMPPQLGDTQVNCGPDWRDESAPDGRVLSLATPAGDYDLAALVAKLPPEQQPDVVVCLVDASWRNVPRNLAALRCPRVLLVADTHHLRSPLIGMIRYLAAEPFERVVFLYDRHHAPFFHSAGFRNLHWFPGLTFPHGDAAVQAARSVVREPQVAFVGQTGPLHPRRTRLLGALTQRGIRVSAKPLGQREALGHYGSSLLGFNASLNGDLNLRIFEILASGAALLTDGLAPASGLDRIFPDGRALTVYRDEAELAAMAVDWLRHPAEAVALGAAGARWFDRHLSETRRRAAFRTLVFDGVSAPEFEFTAEETTRVFFGGDTDRLLESVMVYEGVQEVHRRQETVGIALGAEAPAELGEIFATLPRVRLTAPGAAADLAVFGCAQAGSIGQAPAGRIWFHDVAPADSAALEQTLEAAGFRRENDLVAVFARPGPAAVAKPASEATQAREAFQRGDFKTALTLARNALARDNHCAPAMVVLGDLALTQQGGPLAEKLFRQALQRQPGDPAIEARLGEALRIQGRLRPAAECFERVLRARPEDLSTWLALARVREAEGRPEAAETALRTAVRTHPAAAEAARELGDLLKRRGSVPEALGWHRRSLGYTDAIPLPRPAGKRQAVFVAQHASTWTSMAPIFAAFRADPDWETTLVALPYNHPYLPDPADRTAIYAFLEKEGLPFVHWERFDLSPGCADVLFLQNPYEVTRPAGWTTPDLLRVVPRIAYAPYAIEIGGTIEDATHQFNLPLQNLAWAVFARSEEHRALFAKHGRVGNAHVIVTGHPKFDLLCDPTGITPDAGLVDFARGRPLVLWNPHFDIRPDGSGYSTFLTWWKFLPEEMARRPDLALVIRPHPLFFTTLESRRLLTRTQIDDFLGRCAAAGNIRIDRSPSYLAVFAAADALISDGASFLLEFGVSGKPVCYLHNPRGPFGQLHYEVDLGFVREECAWAEREDDLRRFLNGVKTAGGPAQAARAAAARRLLSVNPAGAGAAIKRAVEARLDAELGAAEPARPPAGTALQLAER